MRDVLKLTGAMSNLWCQKKNQLGKCCHQILSAIEQTSLAIETVSTTAEQSAASSEGILNSVDETTFAIKEVAKSAQRQAELSDELNTLIQKFKI